MYLRMDLFWWLWHKLQSIVHKAENRKLVFFLSYRIHPTVTGGCQALNISAWDGGGSGAYSARKDSPQALTSAAYQQHLSQCRALSGLAQWPGNSPRSWHPLRCSPGSGGETYWSSSYTSSCILWLFQVNHNASISDIFFNTTQSSNTQ